MSPEALGSHLNLRHTVFMLNSVLFRQHIEEGEVLSRVVHKHWIVAVRDIFWAFLFTCVSLVLLLTWPQGLAFWIVLGCITVCAVWLLHDFFDYALDAWVITDQAVIDLNWIGWFHRQSTRVLYSDIQGVSYEIHGVLGTLLKFGTVSIEKISTGSTFSLPYVSRPKEVESLILKNMEAYVHKKNLKNSKHVQELLSVLVANQAQREELDKKSSNKSS